MRCGPRGAPALLGFLLVSLLILPPSAAAQQAVYHRVAPRIFVPFDPQAATVLHRSENLFVVEIPHRGYAFAPRIAAFGDRVIFVSAESTLAFTSVYLDGVKVLRIPQDTPGAPPEVRRLVGAVSFDRPARVIAFVCETAPGGLKLAEKEICAVRSDGTGLRRLTRPLRSDESQYNHAAAPAVSADGRLVVYRRQHAGYLGAVGTDGTGPRVLVPQADGLTPVVLARRAVFYLRDGQVWRAGLDGSGARQLTRERGEIRALAADQDGRRVAYVARESGRAAGITVVDGNTGAVLHTIPGVAPPGGWGPDQSLRVSGDGRRLLFAGQSGGRHGIYVVDLATRMVVEVSAGIKAGIGADLNETGEIAVMTREEGPPLALAFLPDETPPDLWIDDPRPGSSASGESVSVAIRYRDRAVVSGVDPATLTVLVNGRDVSVRLEKEPERASGRLGREFLKDGENVLEARIRDRAGNESRQTVRFHVVPGLLAEFHMAGGIAGIGQRLRVFRDGLARVDSDHASYCARLDQERLERLRRTLDQAGFPGLRPEYRPAHPVVDGHTYRVTYQGHMVTTQDPTEDAAPAALRAVIREFAALVRQVREQKHACP